MTTAEHQRNHDDIMSLLPWFVNKTLDDAQTALVSDHVSSCDECQREIQLLGSMQEAVLDSATSTHQDRLQLEKGLTQVMSMIDAGDAQARSPVKAPSYIRRIAERALEWISASPLALQGGVALCGVLLAVIVFNVYNGQPTGDYAVLSSSDAPPAAIRLSVEVAESVDRDDMQAVMRTVIEKHGKDAAVEAGENGGLIIAIRDAMDVSELSDFVVDLNNQASVQRVEILP